MTTASKHRSAWVRGGTAVEATSARDAAIQAGLNWTVRTAPLAAEATPLYIDPNGVTCLLYTSDAADE